jgi:nucleoside-diphosphate-sugar epimerase
MRILIAGATGVVGRPLTELLALAGHDVVGMSRSPERAEILRCVGARPLVLDVYDRDGLFAALAAERPDAVMHQLTDLSSGTPGGNARIRIEGTRNLVDAARAAGVRRMVAQSIACVYAPGDGPAREEEPLDLDAPQPRRQTVEAVKALEDAVAEMTEGVVLRYGAFYGLGSRYASDGAAAEQARRGELKATPAVTSFIHVLDAARAAMLALDWPPGAVNVVDDEPAPATAWLPVFAEAMGAPPPPPGTEVSRAARGASNAKARRRLGWEPIYPTWREGFRRALG